MQIYFPLQCILGASLVVQRLKRLPAMWKTWVRSLGQEDPWRKKWQPTPVFLPRKSHGWRSLVGYGPGGCKESDTTEQLHFLFTFNCYTRNFYNKNVLASAYIIFLSFLTDEVLCQWQRRGRWKRTEILRDSEIARRRPLPSEQEVMRMQNRQWSLGWWGHRLKRGSCSCQCSGVGMKREEY